MIKLSFADIQCDTYAETIGLILKRLIDIYMEFGQYLDFIDLNPKDRKYFFDKSAWKNVSRTTAALSKLCEILVYQDFSKPIILIDAYDTPLQAAWEHGYYSELSKYMKDFFINTCLVGDEYYERVLITGSTRSFDENLYFGYHDVYADARSNFYADSFGFTEKEVFAAMDEYGLTNKEEVKYWYGGYTFGDHKDIYNPFSIIEFLSTHDVTNYCGNTSLNTFINKIIAHASATEKEDCQQLLQREAISTPLDQEDKSSLFALLLDLGFVQPVEYDAKTDEYKIVLTNHDMKLWLEKILSQLFHHDAADRDAFRQALVSDDLSAMNTHLSDLLKKTLKYFDRTGQEPDRFYLALMLYLSVDLKEQYEVTLKKSEDKCCDLIMIPKRKCDHGIIIEFRIRDAQEERFLKTTCKNALKHIKEHGYINQLFNNELKSENIYVYGFAFNGRNVLICGGAHKTIDWKKIAK